MYQVLYRKWRPRVFADVAGQPHITVTLKNELVANRLAHAYLFTGSRGTGKTTCAKILAKAVNCLESKDGDPCNRCENCIGIENGSILDVVEIDAASNNGVDNIRDLREEASFTPATAKYRVYIIDEVHMLSIGAFNALLKTLEEPPLYVLFILATTEAHKIPATILSRCQRFDFCRIPAEDIASRITHVSEEEGWTLTQDAALLIAQISDGALRDALSLLDQCAGVNKNIDEATVTRCAGLSNRDYLFELSLSVIREDPKAAFGIIQQLHDASRDMARLCEELIAHFRNLMLVKTLEDARPLIVCPAGEYKQLDDQVKQLELSAIIHCLTVLENMGEKLSFTNHRRALIEMAFVKMCNPRVDSSPEALVRRIRAIEGQIRSGSLQTIEQKQEDQMDVKPQIEADQGQQATPSQKVVDTPETAIPNPPQDSDERVLECWSEIMAELAVSSPPLHGVLNGSTAYVCGNRVLVDASNAMFIPLIKQDTQRELLRTAIQNHTGQRYNLGPYVKQQTSDAITDDPLLRVEAKLKQAGICAE